MIKYFCDSCKKEILYGAISEVNIDSNKERSCMGGPSHPLIQINHFILCDDCSKDFNDVLRRFFDSKKDSMFSSPDLKNPLPPDWGLNRQSLYS